MARLIEIEKGAWVGCSPKGGFALAMALLAGMVLAGCSSQGGGSAQVVERGKPGRGAQAANPVRQGQYVVQRGDTLYSIAFRFGWDWRQLASSNRIAPPYTIHPGQVVRFDGRPATSSSIASTTRQQTTTRPVQGTPTQASSAPAQTGRSTAPVVSKPAATAAATSPVNISGNWAWPASGALIGRYSSNGSLNKGIDIAGQLGQPVLAAASGSVVYAGSGLRGYGELLIIKHSDTYVSAYAHNSKLLVREGQQVKAGQQIAEMGSTGTDRVKLHFEIRRQGKPVDPLQYLPKR